MIDPYKIRVIEHADIDRKKWDYCIQRSPNGLIYAYSFYLDHMSPGWKALVYDDYHFVMPLTWKRKFSIGYLYQPFLAAQLGVFGIEHNSEISTLFIDNIPRSFKYIDIYLNEGNRFEHDSSYLRVNYLLRLDKDYALIKLGYSENILRNLKKAEQAEYVCKTNIDAKLVIDLALAQMKFKDRNTAENFKRFENLLDTLAEKGMTETYGIFTKDNDLLSSCIFFRSHERAYYILVGNHPSGRTGGSSHFLIDSFIRNNAGKQITLDFEGSDIESLARFYGGFGATRVNYPAIKINRLPFFLRWMKS